MAVRPTDEYPVLYLSSTLRAGGVTSDPRLGDFTGRRTISLHRVATRLISNPLEAVCSPDVHGVVISMSTGLPDIEQLRFAEYVLSHRSRVWFYWPGESAVECIGREEIKSYTRHFMVRKVWETVRPSARLAYTVMTKLMRTTSSEVDDPVVRNCKAELDRIITEAEPVRFDGGLPSIARPPLQRVGVYLRTDYWAPLASGGSYGHTCYLARSLARTVEHLICLTPSHYTLLDLFGLTQIVMPRPGPYISEKDFLLANSHYYRLLRPAIESAKPAFIYERLCLGNYCGARVSQELGIPYIVEYNGSEIEMSRTFSGHRFKYEDLFIRAEEAAFRQAEVISVVSDVLKDDLVARGIAASKILVNPNGVDPEEYAPPSEAERAKTRSEMGFHAGHTVVGFTGTFGGWHGIDVLAEAFPQICERNSRARFLLVGDGPYKHLVDTAVKEHRLEDRVVCPGRVPQQEGARLLQACDIFVSPHSRVMSNGRFFGSPTKLFEYMAMGRGIVASDLDQIGQILSPALRASNLNGRTNAVGAERAILCQPGDVTEFVRAVEYLIQNPETAVALGLNARQTALANHTWDSHIQNLWQFLAQIQRPIPMSDTVSPGNPGSRTTVSLRDEIRNAWRNGKPHTLEWYQKIEQDRRHPPNAWLNEVPFDKYASKKVLEIGGGIGSDLVRFAKHGAAVTYLNPSSENLELAMENFRLHNLAAQFVHQAGGPLPFPGDIFDLVYCPEISDLSDPAAVVAEIFRILKPGGRLIGLASAENSYHHWVVEFLRMGMIGGLLTQFSLAEVVSRSADNIENHVWFRRLHTKPSLSSLLAQFEINRLFQTPSRIVGRYFYIDATKGPR